MVSRLGCIIFQILERNIYCRVMEFRTVWGIYFKRWIAIWLLLIIDLFRLFDVIASIFTLTQETIFIFKFHRYESFFIIKRFSTLTCHLQFDMCHFLFDWPGVKFLLSNLIFHSIFIILIQFIFNFDRYVILHLTPVTFNFDASFFIWHVSFYAGVSFWIWTSNFFIWHVSFKPF